MEVVHTVSSVGKRVSKGCRSDSCEPDNFCFLGNILDNFFSFENPYCEVVTSHNKLIDAILIKVQESKRLYIITTHGPEPLLPIDIKARNIAITANDNNWLPHIWQRISAA